MDAAKLDDLVKNKDLNGCLEYLFRLKVDNGDTEGAIKTIFDRCRSDEEHHFAWTVEEQFRLANHFATLKVLIQNGSKEEAFLYASRNKEPGQQVEGFFENTKHAYESLFGPVTEKFKLATAPVLIFCTIQEGIIQKVRVLASKMPKRGRPSPEILQELNGYLKSVLYLLKDQHQAMRHAFDFLAEEQSLNPHALADLESGFFHPLRQEYALKMAQAYHDKKYEHVEALLDKAGEQKLDIKDIFLQVISNAHPSHEKQLRDVLHLYEAISGLGFEEHGLLPHDIVKICLFAERKLRGEGKEHPKFYTKEQKGHALPCSLIIDKAQHLFYVLLENKELPEDLRSTEKCFTPTIVVDKIKKEARLIGLTHRFRYPKDLELNIERLTRYSGKRGLAGLLFQAKFKKPAQQPETSLAHELFLHDLIPFTHLGGSQKHPKKKLPLKDMVVVILDVACGIEAMHAMDDIHGDIKLENILYGEKEGKPQAALTDFGLSFHSRTEHPLWVGFWYGTIFYTPPEFLEFPYSRHDYKAADMYALGCTLYELTTGPIPWYDDIDRLDLSSDKFLMGAYIKNPSQENKKSFIDTFDPDLKTAVLDKQKQVAGFLQEDEKNKDHFKSKDELLFWVKKLLHPDPSKRPTAQQFRQSIACLLEKLD